MAIWIGPPKATEPDKQYRVEHHECGQIELLARVEGVFPHHRTLEPFVTTLLRQGADGVLVLIDESTDCVVARRKVRPFKNKPFASVHRPKGQYPGDRTGPIS